MDLRSKIEIYPSINACEMTLIVYMCGYIYRLYSITREPVLHR